MAICIYCNENKKLSDEDYFPRSLGKFRGFEKLKDKICRDCNSNKFSQLEEEFSRCSPEAFYRWIQGIKGRKHHAKPNPFYRRSAGNPPIKITTTHPSLGIKIYCEVPFGALKQRPITGYFARQFIVKDKEGELHAVIVTDDIQNPEDLEKAIKEQGIEGCKFFDAVIPEEDFPLMNKIGAIFNEEIKEKGIVCNNFTNGLENIIECTFTKKYFQAVAKIAFHYFLKHFSEYSGLESEFDGIKRFIVEGGKKEHWMKIINESFLYELNHFAVQMPCSHFIAVEKNEYGITARLQFFVFPDKDPTEHYLVHLGKNPHRIIHQGKSFHQFEYFDSPDNDGFDGIVKTAPSVSKAFISYLGLRSI